MFERSKIPLTKWWMASHLLNSSKKGMSSHQTHRMLATDNERTVKTLEGIEGERLTYRIPHKAKIN